MGSSSNKKSKYSASSSSSLQPPSHSFSTSQPSTSSSSFIATHHPEKPSARAIEKEGGGKNWTVSIAIPGSIVLNAQTMELRGWLAGQIARTCAIFSVTEIVVYKDTAVAQPTFKPRGKYRETAEESKEEEDPATFLARILEYLETPQYLRKALFPLHPSLRLAGLLPPLDCPHHLRRDDVASFREGVTVSVCSCTSDESDGRTNKRKKNDEGKVMVDIGLWEPVEATGGEGVPINTRVTVRTPSGDSIIGALVPPSTPTVESGLYWGYQVRLAASLAAVFSESPYASEGGYDISIGTSERGTPIEGILTDIPSFRHLLLTFGPLSGLELTIASDPLIPLEAEDASDLFDYWINVVEGQGSRTVRTEEALPIALARLKSTLESKGLSSKV